MFVRRGNPQCCLTNTVPRGIRWPTPNCRRALRAQRAQRACMGPPGPSELEERGEAGDPGRARRARRVSCAWRARERGEAGPPRLASSAFQGSPTLPATAVSDSPPKLQSPPRNVPLASRPSVLPGNAPVQTAAPQIRVPGLTQARNPHWVPGAASDLGGSPVVASAGGHTTAGWVLTGVRHNTDLSEPRETKPRS